MRNFYNFYHASLRIPNHLMLMPRTWAEDNPIEVKSRNVTEKKEYITIDLKIPIFIGRIDEEIKKSINRSIENDVMEFKRQMEEAAIEGAQKAQAEEREFKPYIVSVVYQVTYNKNNILSVSMIYYEHISGRNSYIKTSYNYDLVTGKSMGLRDLFKEGVAYQALLNQEVKKELTQNKDKYFPGAAEAFEGVAIDQPFYLENGNIVIYFGFHQIAPVVSEIPLIRIPFSAVRNDLKQGLLRSLCL